MSTFIGQPQRTIWITAFTSKNNKFLEEFTATLDGKHMPMSLQGFIFMIQEKTASSK